MQRKGSAGLLLCSILRYGSYTQTHKQETDYVAAATAPNIRQKLAMWDHKPNAALKRRTLTIFPLLTKFIRVQTRTESDA